MRVIGLMSGTSLDAIDAALVEIRTLGSALEVEPVRCIEREWPAALRDRVRGWSDPSATVAPGELAATSMEIGELFSAAADACAGAAGVELAAIDLIGSHGQTVHHHVDADGRVRATLQLGQPAVIAEQTGITVAADFRPRDIAAGGQGAPLVSFVDALVLGDQERTVAALNLGGIANVTVVPASSPSGAIAFDTGPGNSLLDAAARQLLGRPFDDRGVTAAAGEPSEQLLDELLAEPYFSRRPPKSTGRELFGDEFAARAAGRARELGLDAPRTLATLSELTGRSVARALLGWAPAWPAVIYVSGGGTHNHALMRVLERALANATPPGAEPPALAPIDEIGLPSAAKEAICFAVLGHETLHGRINNLPGATGARQPTVLGAIWPGRNYPRLVEHVGRSRQPRERIDRIVVRRSSEQRKGVAR